MTNAVSSSFLFSRCRRSVLTDTLCCPDRRRSAIFLLTSSGALQALEAMCRFTYVTLADRSFLQQLQTARLGSEHTVVKSLTGSDMVIVVVESGQTGRRVAGGGDAGGDGAQGRVLVRVAARSL